MLQRWNNGDGCDLASTLCKYDLRKGYLFVLSWPRVRRAMRGNISSELRMCGGGMRSISCVYMERVCFYVCYSDCVGVCGNVCCVAAVVEDSVSAMEC